MQSGHHVSAFMRHASVVLMITYLGGLPYASSMSGSIFSHTILSKKHNVMRPCAWVIICRKKSTKPPPPHYLWNQLCREMGGGEPFKGATLPCHSSSAYPALPCPPLLDGCGTLRPYPGSRSSCLSGPLGVLPSSQRPIPPRCHLTFYFLLPQFFSGNQDDKYFVA